MRRKKITASLLIIMMLFTIAPHMAFADIITTSVPEINAVSYIVVDSSTGEVLFGKNYQQQCAPASITKIMTAILAIESGKLDSNVTVSDLPDFGDSGAVTIHLAKGESYSLKSLVEVMLVASANDAAYVIADAVSGSAEKFVTKMNEKANELGMSGTVFKNPHGLDEDGHLVTAEDMAKLARYAMQNETFREMVKVQQVNWQGGSYEKPLPTTNKLFSIMPEAIGVKTGHTNNAQYTLVGAAQKDGRELIGVILGAPDENIFQNMKKILTYGFEHTKVVPVIQKDALETTLQFGENKQVRVVAGEDYSVLQSTDNASIVSYQRKLTDIELPIKKNTQVGVLEVLVDGNVIHEVPLMAQDDMRKPINWLFIITIFLSVVYIASICSRIVNNVRRAQRKKAANRTVASAPVKRNQYENLVSSVEHPKQQTRTSGKRTLSSSRDRDTRR